MFWRRKRTPQDFSEELRAHLALEADQLRREGVTDAQFVARKRLGNLVGNQERFYEASRWIWIDQLRQDLRLAARQLSKSKGFTIVAVLTLALGIGANTAVFTLINAVMLRPLPVNHAEQIYRLGDADKCCVIGGTQGKHFSIFSYPLYQYLRDGTPEVEQMAAFLAGLGKFSVRRGGISGVPEAFDGEFVSGNYFPMFGVAPVEGRAITADDDRPGAAPVAVMSHRAWQQRYAQDHSVVGSAFVINGVAATLVGVMPASFFGDTLRADPPDFWIPLSAEPAMKGQNSLLSRPDQHWLYILGRLKPGSQVPAIEAKVNLLLKQWLIDQGGTKLTPARRQMIERERVAVVEAAGGVGSMKNEYADGLRLLMGIAGLVLVIACANIANLLLARRTAGRLPAAVRVALGASRGRVVRQSLTECVVLGLLGGAAGLFVAFAGTQAILALAFHGSRFVPIHTDPSLPVLGFTFLLSLVASMIFGVAPAWLGSRVDPADVLRGANRSTGNSSTLPQKSLVILQAALSVVLLAYAGLLTVSLRNLEHQKFGYETDRRLMLRVNTSFAGYRPEQLQQVYRQLGEKLSRVPGVESASFSLYSPMENMNWSGGILVEGRPMFDAAGHMPSSSWDRVSAHYFETIGTRLVRGRPIDESDLPGSRRVAVVNQAFAKAMFPNEDAIGHRFGQEAPSDYEIVGIVEDTKYTDARKPMGPMFFLPLLQMTPADWSNSGLARSNYINDIQIHTAGNVTGLEPALRQMLLETDRNITMMKLASFGEQLSLNFNQERLLARLTGLFGLVALVLASIGLYGVTAYAVVRRTSEIGVRVALGASRRAVIGMVLRSAFLQTALGLAIGIPAALGGARVLASRLYGVQAYDPKMLAAATLVLGASAFVAALVPAYRAAGIDPVKSLRTE